MYMNRVVRTVWNPHRAIFRGQLRKSNEIMWEVTFKCYSWGEKWEVVAPYWLAFLIPRNQLIIKVSSSKQQGYKAENWVLSKAHSSPLLWFLPIFMTQKNEETTLKWVICILSELVVLSPDSAPSCCLYCFQNSFPDTFDVTSLLIHGPFCPNPAFWHWRYSKSPLEVQTEGRYPGCPWVEALSSGHRFCWSRSALAFFLQQA